MAQSDKEQGVLEFINLERGVTASGQLRNVVVLRQNNWDDYGFKTTFHATYVSDTGEQFDLGDVKIAYASQQEGWTATTLQRRFVALAEGYFSLGQSAEYYATICRTLPEGVGVLILNALRDAAFNPALLSAHSNERAFQDSLSRSVSRSTIRDQFKRIIDGGVVLTEFKFNYKREEWRNRGSVALSFRVVPNSTPPSNLHVLIGRNGVGKTTILDDMAQAVTGDQTNSARHGSFSESHMFSEERIDPDYFSSVTSISFSAFDPFSPVAGEQALGMPPHIYIGLKPDAPPAESDDTPPLKNIKALASDFVDSLQLCMALRAKQTQWSRCVELLEADPNFAEMNLGSLVTLDAEVRNQEARRTFRRMSSGHAIVMLSMTRLVECMQEKSLVLLDEPESHLHPPLLAGFTRALSWLLIQRNAVAIVATHSPVVLQEVPKSCAWKLSRSGAETAAWRPEIETFGENVGVLTREVFGLEVAKSGFHNLLQNAVDSGESFESIVGQYRGQIGFEGQTMLRAMIAARDGG